MTSSYLKHGERDEHLTDDHATHSTPRLALFLPSLRGGGAERMFITLANGFAARGYMVDMVLCQAEGPYLEDVNAAVRVVDLAAASVARALPRLVGYLRKEHPQALLSGLRHANVVALLADRMAGAGTRIVVSERNTFSAARVSRLHRLMGLLMRLTYPGASAVTAVSHGVADDLSRSIGLRREKIQVLYNPVVTEQLRTRAELPLTNEWVMKAASPIILGVGRLSPQKDFETLVRAFADVRARRAARLVILGDGPAREQLEQLVHELGCRADVLMPGFQTNPFPWMRHASVFVLSSAWEGLPGVLIQAMACGTPVVSTDCPSGPAEILENGRWGALVPVGDVDAMARKIESVLDCERLPNATERALDFEAEIAIDRHLEVLLVAE